MSLNARQSAFEIIKFLNISSPEDIRIEDIAFLRGLITIEKDVIGSEGRMITKAGRGVIAINKDLIPRKKRFVVAHELGHFELHRTSGGNICSTEDIVGYHQSKPRENEANEFASEILMPSFLWDKKQFGNKPNWDSIKGFADYFQTSLTATALKYIDFFQYPVTLICCEDFKVKWFSANKYCHFYHRGIGTEIQKESLAHEVFADSQKEHKQKIVLSSTWFNDFKLGQDRYFHEDCFFAKKYGYTLSLIWECKEFA